MASIIDVSSRCPSKAAALRAAGVSVVIRYYSRDTIRPSKRLSREEAQALAGAGLRLGVVHEARRGDLADSFEHASGIADARYARTYGASTIGQPAGSAIYFAVDFDATASQIRNLIVPYFRGVADAFAEASGEPDYVVGAYGSGAVCAALLDANLVKKTWLAQSRGWMGTGFLVDVGAAPGAPTAGAMDIADAVCVPELIRQGSSAEGLKAARTTAKAALQQYPTNGCAAHLSALLQQAGIDVPMTFGAGKLAHVIADRGWARIAVGSQQPGDVGVCFDNDPTPAGADHVYLVVGTSGPDEMMIADNQRRNDAPHTRFASGRGGKTPTEYFLRAL